MQHNQNDRIPLENAFTPDFIPKAQAAHSAGGLNCCTNSVFGLQDLTLGRRLLKNCTGPVCGFLVCSCLCVCSIDLIASCFLNIIIPGAKKLYKKKWLHPDKHLGNVFLTTLECPHIIMKVTFQFQQAAFGRWKEFHSDAANVYKFLLWFAFTSRQRVRPPWTCLWAAIPISPLPVGNVK